MAPSRRKKLAVCLVLLTGAMIAPAAGTSENRPFKQLWSEAIARPRPSMDSRVATRIEGDELAREDASPESPAVRASTRWRSGTTAPLRRVAEARESKLAVVQRLFAEARVSFPPAQMVLRAFKAERRLELWASSRPADAMSHVTTYEICAASGSLGPKRKQGDAQVPEGFYTLSDYNPASNYYLAMLVSYPNLSDRILGDKRDPGGEIMIHGRCASAGCLAMSDDRIQEIWVATTALRSVGGVVQVHIYPTRDMAGLLAKAEGEAHRRFWENLQEGFDHFEKHRKIRAIRVDRGGRYLFH